MVTSVEWTNPHVYIYIDTTDAKTKKVTNWGFEMGPPHMLQKAGWKRNSLKIGEVVVIDGWLARDGTNHGNARKVTRKSTGEVLGAASSNAQTLAGNQGTKPPAAGVTPAAPATPAVTAEFKGLAMRTPALGALALTLVIGADRAWPGATGAGCSRARAALG